MKKVFISVTNDLSTDQRVAKVAQSLVKFGFKVTLVGRFLPDSKELKRSYPTKRMRLLFKKGPLFYAEYNIRLFLLLLFSKADILLANDLDTLLANYAASKLKGISLVYDSHELYTEVPELISRPKTQAIWLKIEEYIFPKLKHVYTVNKSIADIYISKYQLPVKVVKNLPLGATLPKSKSRKELDLPEEKKVIILQGAGINIDRGGEELIEAMRFLPEYFLVIVGSGDVVQILQQRTLDYGISNYVRFLPRMNYSDMMQYTLNADLGVTLDKDTNLNYRYSLPNKIFDYLKAGIPVLSSKLPELERIIEDYKVGVVLQSHNPEEIANCIRKMFSNEQLLNTYKENAKFAAAKLNWESQEVELAQIFNEIV